MYLAFAVGASIRLGVGEYSADTYPNYSWDSDHQHYNNSLAARSNGAHAHFMGYNIGMDEAGTADSWATGVFPGDSTYQPHSHWWKQPAPGGGTAPYQLWPPTPDGEHDHDWIAGTLVGRNPYPHQSINLSSPTYISLNWVMRLS
jgi:hypothetical protein